MSQEPFSRVAPWARKERRSMGAAAAALSAGALLVVACIAVVSQAPARQRPFELESQQQAILAGAERAGFKAGEREEAKRQLMLGADLQKQMLSDKDWTTGKSSVKTSGKAGESGLQEMLNSWGWTSPATVQVHTSPVVQVQGSPMIQQVVHTSPVVQQVVHTSPMTVQVHTPAIWTGATPFVQVPQSTIVQAPAQPIVQAAQPQVVRVGKSQVVQAPNVATIGGAPSARPAPPAMHVAPAPPISPQMAVASAGSAVSSAAQYHSNGASKDADEWSACFDEASGSGPCTPYTRSRSSFPPYAIKGKHPGQPYQHVKQMSPNQAVSNAAGNGWGDENAWTNMEKNEEAQEQGGVVAEAGQEAGAGAPTGSSTVAETPAGETPTGSSTVAETPAGETPTGSSTVAETPAGETPTGSSTVAETPAGETPTGSSTVAETPAGETPTGSSTVAETPAGETPETPAGETPAAVGETPAAVETPAGETPAAVEDSNGGHEDGSGAGSGSHGHGAATGSGSHGYGHGGHGGNGGHGEGVGIVQGKAYDITTGNGIAHAQVHLDYAGQELFSAEGDGQGNFEIHAPPAAYEATAFAEGYCTASESADVHEDHQFPVTRPLALSPVLSAGQVRLHLTSDGGDDSFSLSIYGPGGCVIDGQGSSCGQGGVEAAAQMWTDKAMTATFTSLADGVYQIHASSATPLAGKRAKLRLYTEGCSAESMRRFNLLAGDGVTGDGLGESFVAAPAAAIEAASGEAGGGHDISGDGPHFDDESGDPYVPSHAGARGGSVWFVAGFSVNGGVITFHHADHCPALGSAVASSTAETDVGEARGEVAVEGRVIDGQTGLGLSDATVELFFAGQKVAEGMTDSEGTYSILAVPSPYQMIITHANYMVANVDVSVSEHGIVGGGRIITSKELAPGQMRMVLTWQDPDDRIDLDFHIVTPLEQDGHFCKISYYNKECKDASAGIDLELDLDSLHGGGPETVTFKQTMPGDYYIYMDRYTWMAMSDTHGVMDLFLPIVGVGSQRKFSLDAGDGVIGSGYHGHHDEFTPDAHGRVWFVTRINVGADGVVTVAGATSGGSGDGSGLGTGSVSGSQHGHGDGNHEEDDGIVDGKAYDITTGNGIAHAQVHLDYAGQELFSAEGDGQGNFEIHAPPAAYEATAFAEGYCTASESVDNPEPHRPIARPLALSPVLSAGQVRLHLTSDGGDDSFSLSIYGPGGCVIDGQGSSCGQGGVEAAAQMWTDKAMTATFTSLADGVYQVYATSVTPLAGKRAKLRLYTEGCSAESMRRFNLLAGDGATGDGLGETFVPAATEVTADSHDAKLMSTQGVINTISQMLAGAGSKAAADRSARDIEDALQRLTKKMNAVKAERDAAASRGSSATGRHLLDDGPHFGDESGDPYVPPHAGPRGGSVWFVTCFSVDAAVISFHHADHCPALGSAPEPEALRGEVAAEGRVIDGQTGHGLSDATVELFFAGQKVAEGMTDSEGTYSILAVPSPYQMIVTHANYMVANVDVSVSEHGIVGGGRIITSKELAPGQMRMVLTWQDPDDRIDLDFHIVTPLEQDGHFCKISYYNKECKDASAGIDLELDLDSLHGGGPETVTFKQTMPGDYYIYMDRYTWMAMSDTHGVMDLFLPIVGVGSQRKFSLDAGDGVIGSGYHGHHDEFTPDAHGRVWFVAKIVVGPDGNVRVVEG